MPRRAAGSILPLEYALLAALVDAPEHTSFGAALAAVVTSDPETPRRLLGHGTLYKALQRLEAAGLVESNWEQGDPQELGRPLRRMYVCTGLGEVLLARRPDTARSGALPRPALS